MVLLPSKLVSTPHGGLATDDFMENSGIKKEFQLHTVD